MIKVESYFTNKDVVAVALSGGKDSMVLLHVLYNALPKGNVKAINVEHGIRGEESLSDTEFVKNYCKKLGIELLCFSANCIEFSRQNGLSLEEGARAVRYDFFKQAVDDGFCNYVATAHHLSDSVETILFNLFRGASPNGVAVIESRNYVIRPLSEISRQQIDLYAQKHDIPFVLDSTNLDQTYTRNYIRSTILPAIKQRFPEAEKAIERFSKLSTMQDDYITLIAEKQLTELNGEISFKEDLPIAIRYKCVTLALKKLGLVKDYEFRHCLEVDKLSLRKNGDVIDFPKNIKCVKDYGKITFYKSSSLEITSTPFKVGKINLGEKNVIVTDKQTDGFLKFSLDSLPKDCVIRTRNNGDEFTPFGGKTKKLKKYLIDKKIPCRVRDNLLLVAKEQEVFIIIGVEISDKIKVTTNEKIYYIGEYNG